MSTPSIPTPTLAETPAALRERFRRLADQWKEQSRYLSNSAQMAVLPAISGSSAWAGRRCH